MPKASSSSASAPARRVLKGPATYSHTHDYRADPSPYRVGRGEGGVLTCQPYSPSPFRPPGSKSKSTRLIVRVHLEGELLPLWRFATLEQAEQSAGLSRSRPASFVLPRILDRSAEFEFKKLQMRFMPSLRSTATRATFQARTSRASSSRWVLMLHSNPYRHLERLIGCSRAGYTRSMRYYNSPGGSKVRFVHLSFLTFLRALVSLHPTLSLLSLSLLQSPLL